MATSTVPRRRPLRTSIRTQGVVTLPLEVRQELDLHEGDDMLVSVQNGSVPDGRATFHYGNEIKEGHQHIVWRWIGAHSIFGRP